MKVFRSFLLMAAAVSCAFAAMPCASYAAAAVLPWMRNDARITYELKTEGSKSYLLTVRSTLSNVQVSNNDDGAPMYSAHVVAETNVTLPDGGSLSDIPAQEYDLSVDGSKVKVSNFKIGLGSVASSANADTGSGLSPFLAYTGRDISEGKKFPGHSSQVTNTVKNFGGGKDAVVKIDTKYSEKTVGKRETIKTALGDLSCWPVSYSVTIKGEPTKVATDDSSADVTLTLKEHRTDFVEWFSPKYNLVVKSEATDASGAKSTMTVVSIQ